MEKVFIGRVVATHGIKGELRILSDFPYKDKVFKIDNKLIIDDTLYTIKSYRIHKNFDMVTLDSYNNINDVLFLLKKNVYFDKDNLCLEDNQVLDSELIDYKVIKGDEEGKITEIFMASSSNKILRVMFKKEVLIPFDSPFVKKIDKDKKIIEVQIIEGM